MATKPKPLTPRLRQFDSLGEIDDRIQDTPEPSVPDLTRPTLSPQLKALLDDIFASTHVNFGPQGPIEVPCDLKLYDLQSVLLEKGFNPLATDQVVAGRAEEFYGDVDFIKPHDFFVPVDNEKNHLRFPVVSIDRIQESLKLIFGHLIQITSGWRITNNEHPRSNPENLIVPSAVSYFKFQ